MKKQWPGFLAGVLASVLVFGLSVTSMAAYQKQAVLEYSGIKVTLNGAEITPTDAAGNPIEPFAIDGTTYLPVRGIASALGLDVSWNGATQTVVLKTKGETASSEDYKVQLAEREALDRFISSNGEIQDQYKEWVDVADIQSKDVDFQVLSYEGGFNRKGFYSLGIISSTLYEMPSLPNNFNESPYDGTFDGIQIKVENNELYFKQSDLISHGIIKDAITEPVWIIP